METPTEAASAPDAPPPSIRVAPPEARQRWQLTFRRDLDPGERGLVGRDYAAIWDEALARSGLPIARTTAGRLRFGLGAPLPASASGEAELAELWLTARLPGWRLRDALTPALPPGHRITDLEDVWIGAPALSARVAAADYRMTLAEGPDDRAVAAACSRVLAAASLPRERPRGGAMKSYDLRPLLISIHSGGGAATARPGEEHPKHVVIGLRTRIHPELGSGRPEEVLAALADEAGIPLEAVEMVRERLVFAEELDR